MPRTPDQVIVEIDVGNDAMQTPQEVAGVLWQVAASFDGLGELVVGDTGSARDGNGNTIVKWRVS
jgi:hypothetical protein